MSRRGQAGLSQGHKMGVTVQLWVPHGCAWAQDQSTHMYAPHIHHTKRNQELIHATTQGNHKGITFSKICQSGSMLDRKRAELAKSRDRETCSHRGLVVGWVMTANGFLLRAMKYSKTLESSSNGHMILWLRENG